jgi:hypothetical protein
MISCSPMPLILIRLVVAAGAGISGEIKNGFNNLGSYISDPAVYRAEKARKRAAEAAAVETFDMYLKFFTGVIVGAFLLGYVLFVGMKVYRRIHGWF